jgi:uncharacterized protein YceK
MKNALPVAALALLALSGCASTVKTYDANGKMIGMYTAKQGFILGAGATCTGTANQEGKDKQ